MDGSRRFVVGYICNCGRIYPRRNPFLPYIVNPEICPNCGALEENMRKSPVVEVRWKIGRIFKTERVRYELPPD